MLPSVCEDNCVCFNYKVSIMLYYLLSYQLQNPCVVRICIQILFTTVDNIQHTVFTVFNTLHTDA